MIPAVWFFCFNFLFIFMHSNTRLNRGCCFFYMKNYHSHHTCSRGVKPSRPACSEKVFGIRGCKRGFPFFYSDSCRNHPNRGQECHQLTPLTQWQPRDNTLTQESEDNDAHCSQPIKTATLLPGFLTRSTLKVIFPQRLTRLARTLHPHPAPRLLLRAGHSQCQCGRFV